MTDTTTAHEQQHQPHHGQQQTHQTSSTTTTTTPYRESKHHEFDPLTRARIIEHAECMGKQSACDKFGITPSGLHALIQRFEERGTLEDAPRHHETHPSSHHEKHKNGSGSGSASASTEVDKAPKSRHDGKSH